MSNRIKNIRNVNNRESGFKGEIKKINVDHLTNPSDIANSFNMYFNEAGKKLSKNIEPVCKQSYSI